MKSKIIYILMLLLMPVGIYAQRKEIAQAKTIIKSGANLNQAEALMENLLKDSLNRKKEKIWLTLFDAVRKQYDQGNELLYLKQPYDTAQLFTTTRKMFTILESFDTIDVDTHNNKPEYRKKHAEFLNTYRPNLYNGGMYFIRKQNFAKAYDFLDTYLNCAVLPMFADYHYADKDKLMSKAGYWATYCGYKMKNTHATLSHKDWALKDDAHRDYLLQYLAETYKQLNDSVNYVKAITLGFKEYPNFPFFFPRLVAYYTQTANYMKALDICNEALKHNPKSSIYRFSKSTILLNTGNYDECIAICDDLIAENDSVAEPYYNAGLSFFNQAVEIDKSAKLSKAKRAKALLLYKKAMPYLERYRQLAPNVNDKWALPLYTIYLNLNKGKEFEEMDAIIKNSKK